MNNNPNMQEDLIPNGLKRPVIHRCGVDQIKIVSMPLDLKPMNGNNSSQAQPNFMMNINNGPFPNK